MKQTWITLLTDFGLEDSYVAQMKGVIAGINPQAVVLDITHAIPPQDIEQAARVLADAYSAFPAGTIHVIVVDPGVGSRRRALAAEWSGHRFVCPDNGILSFLPDPLPSTVVQLDQPRWWRPQLSNTFHGRDLFAPVAAAWSCGRSLHELGSPLTDPIVRLNPPAPTRVSRPDGAIVTGRIVARDHFGNLITNIPPALLPETKHLRIEVDGQVLAERLCACYAEGRPGECLALWNSSGWLEIAIVNGDAAARWHCGPGMPVIVTIQEQP